MKKYLLLLLALIPVMSPAQSYQSNKAIWEQFTVLSCHNFLEITCKYDKCEKKDVDRPIEINFKKNNLSWLAFNNLSFPILSKRYNPISAYASKERNDISFDGSSMNIFNFDKGSNLSKPKFIAVEVQVLKLPVNESEISTATYYSSCYPN